MSGRNWGRGRDTGKGETMQELQTAHLSRKLPKPSFLLLKKPHGVGEGAAAQVLVGVSVCLFLAV